MLKKIIYIYLFLIITLGFLQVVILLQSNLIYDKSFLFLATLIITILTLIITSVLILTLETSIFSQYKSLLKNIKDAGNSATNEHSQKGFYKDIYKMLKKTNITILDLNAFIQNITKLNFDTKLSKVSQNHILAKSLITMRDELKKISDEEDKRRWTMQGLPKFADILRNAQNKNFERWTYTIIKNLAQYLDAQQGAIFLVKSQEDLSRYFELSAVYAYKKEEVTQQEIPINEGYLGQTYQEKKVIQINNIPDTYTKDISSALGKAKPKFLTFIPFINNDKVLGIIELASFSFFEPYQVNFLKNIAESLAISMESFLLDIQRQELLEETALANEELQKREQQMQISAKALEKTQGILSEKIKTIQEETNLIRHILNAIDKTNATIEFDMDGKILEVNQMYLSVMGYSEDDLIGEEETILIGEDELERHTMLWDTLKNGKSLSGEYIRLSKVGKKIWLNGTYNPILNLDGEPMKVIMLAQFTTEEKERELEQNSKIKALGQALTMIDLDTDAKIIKVNQHFLTEIGYKRIEMRRKPITVIIDNKDKPRFEETFEKTIKGETKTINLIFRDVDKNSIQMLAYISPIKKLTGGIEKILMILVNITELENTKKNLLDKQLELRNIIQRLQLTQNDLKLQNQEFENLNEMFHKASMSFELDENYNFIKINSNLREKLAIENDNQIPKNFDDIIFPKFNKESLEDFYDKLSKGKKAQATIKFLSLKEQKIWGNTTITPFENHESKKKYYLGLIIDVSEDAIQSIYLRGEIVALKMTNAMIKYKEVSGNENLTNDNVMDNIKDMPLESIEDMTKHNVTPYLKINEDAKIIDFNTLSLDLLGFREKEFRNKKLVQLISAHGKVDKKEVIKELLDKNKRYDDIIILNDKNRSGLYARVLTVPNNKQTYFFFKIL